MHNFALQLEYVNTHGDKVFHWLPTYETFAGCEWWREWFVKMLTRDHATDIIAVCQAIAGAQP